MQRAGIVRSCYDAFAKNLAEGDGRKRMIRFYFHPTPNPAKVALMLEETGLAYQLVPIDTSKGEQHTPAFRAINPNGKVPAIPRDRAARKCGYSIPAQSCFISARRRDA